MADQLFAREVRLLGAGAVHVQVAQIAPHDRVALFHVVERATQPLLALVALALGLHSLRLITEQDEARRAAFERRLLAAAFDVNDRTVFAPMLGDPPDVLWTRRRQHAS